MTSIYILIGIIIVIGVVAGLLRNKIDIQDEKPKYDYKRRNFFLTQAEHECYDALIHVVGQEYLVFAQVHLPTLLDNKVVGQNWNAAFRHINQKSVDFVLCDKAYISPKLAIELDDKTHERPERQDRDREVERILKGAGMPLLRLENHGKFSSQELAEKIRSALKPSDTLPSQPQSAA
jgi:very-short-patch-repair endonuclease